MHIAILEVVTKSKIGEVSRGEELNKRYQFRELVGKGSAPRLRLHSRYARFEVMRTPITQRHVRE